MINYKNITAFITAMALMLWSVGVPTPAQASHGGALICTEDSLSLVSDVETLADGVASLATYVHPGWSASIPGATWIWSSDFVADPEATTTVSFTKDFTVNDTVGHADLEIAADNTYEVYVNGSLVASSTDSNNFEIGTQDLIDLTAYVVEGLNTLRIDVTNEAGELGDTATDNPAGLLYSLEVLAGNCDGIEADKAHINVIKEVVGGTSVASDFMIDVTGVNVSTSTATSTATSLSIAGSAGTMITLSAGVYDITEATSSDYEVSYSEDCSGDILAGESLTCTITNTFIEEEPADEEPADEEGNISGSFPINNNVNVTVNPNIEVNPTFYNNGGGFLPLGYFDFFDGNVLGAATDGLACVPNNASVAVGEVITFSAVGGDGNYSWSAPGVNGRVGNTFTAYYTTPGASSVTVSSAGQTATCDVTIGGSVLGAQTPGLPNTGMGGGGALWLNLGMILALSGITTMVLRKRAAR